MTTAHYSAPPQPQYFSQPLSTVAQQPLPPSYYQSGGTSSYHHDSTVVNNYGALTPIVNRSEALSRGGATTPPAPKSALKSSSDTGSAPTSDSINSKDMFLHIISFLRERYGDPTPTSPLSEFSEQDIGELVSCFHKELRKVSGKSSAVVVRDPKAPVETAALSHSSPLFDKNDEPQLSPARTVNSMAAPSSSASNAPQVPQSLKESMAILRSGCYAIKYSSKGQPSRRHFHVENRRALVDGEMLSVPHFCWAPTPSEEPTSEFSLLGLKRVEAGASQVTLDAAAKSNGGRLLGPNKEPIDESVVISVAFDAGRTVDVAFPSVAHCRAWEKALRYIVERNKRLR